MHTGTMQWPSLMLQCRTNGIDSNAAVKVEIFAAVCVIEAGALAPGEDEVGGPCIRLQNVPAVNGENACLCGTQP